MDQKPAVEVEFSNSASNPYSYVAHLFVELRGKGLSLSGADLEVIRKWQESDIDPHLISDVMVQIANDCHTDKRIFPSTLAPVARKLDKVLKRKHEF